jgi:hypothetical protein
MTGPSEIRALTEVEQVTVLNEVLDDETLSNYSSDDDSASDYDYTQLVPPETISASKYDSDYEDIMAHGGLEGVQEICVERSRFVSRFARIILWCVWSPVRHCRTRCRQCF